MDKNAVLGIGASDCRPEDEEKYNKWYNEVHVPMCLKFKGIKRASRFKRIGDDKERPKYLVFYEFESKEAKEAFDTSPELKAAMEESKETWKDGGLDLLWVANYEPIKTWER